MSDNHKSHVLTDLFRTLIDVNIESFCFTSISLAPVRPPVNGVIVSSFDFLSEIAVARLNRVGGDSVHNRASMCEYKQILDRC